MPRYEKKNVQVGMMMQLDCSVATPVTVKRGAPPKYGDAQPFKQITEQLDAARKRLEVIAKQVRNARRRQGS